MPSSACPGPPRHLHSFPTRRSSDLGTRGDGLALVDFVGQFRLGGPGPFVQLVQHTRARRPGAGVAAAAAQHHREADGDQRTGERPQDRKSTRLNSSHTVISYAVFCLSRPPTTSTLFPYTTLFRSRYPGGRPCLGRFRRTVPPWRSGPVRPARPAHPSPPPGRWGRRRGRAAPSRSRRRSAHRRAAPRSEEHTSELQSHSDLVCRLLLVPAPHDIYTLSLHDALPISVPGGTALPWSISSDSSALAVRARSSSSSSTPEPAARALGSPPRPRSTIAKPTAISAPASGPKIGRAHV